MLDTVTRLDPIPWRLASAGLARECGREHVELVDTIKQARELVDAAHVDDPVKDLSGCAAELVYADRMEAWVARLLPDASPLLRLAARCQHLERWTVPRSSFPLDREGYHKWRRSLYSQQATRAGELLRQAGVGESAIAKVMTWVSKAGLLRNPGTQALEDAACLVFLEHEVADFAAQHADYPREKLVSILRKTWRKMSPAAHELARTLSLPAVVEELLGEATRELS